MVFGKKVRFEILALAERQCLTLQDLLGRNRFDTNRNNCNAKAGETQGLRRQRAAVLEAANSVRETPIKNQG